MKKLLASLLVICLTVPAIGQISPFLEKGKSGLGVFVAADQGYGFQGLAGSLGGSLKGVLDVEFLYNHDNYDQVLTQLLNDKAVSSGYTGNLIWWLIRKSPIPQLEVNVGLRGSVEYFTYKDYLYTGDTGGESSYDSYFGGHLGFHTLLKINLDDSWSLAPGYYAVTQYGKEYWTEEGVKESGSYFGILSNLSVTLLKKFSGGSTLHLTAYEFLDTYGSQPYYAFLIGCIFPL